MNKNKLNKIFRVVWLASTILLIVLCLLTDGVYSTEWFAWSCCLFAELEVISLLGLLGSKNED